MAAPTSSSPTEALILGCYAVDLTRPLPACGGGVEAFTAIDRSGERHGLMALRVERDLPARAEALKMLTSPIEGVLAPLGHGRATAPDGQVGYFVVCPAPPGQAIGVPAHPWPEAALLDHVLRPVAQALVRLQAAGITHRAIRPNNVFQGGPGEPVVLGAAWAAPPAAHQPAACEPPYAAMCLPAGRGDGTIADDVYALAVLLIVLATGRMPFEDLDAGAIIRRKLEHGSCAALAAGARLPPVIADLARGMLAEDPEHRPPPALLLDASAARGRRVAARPQRRAQRALQFAGMTIWDARSLAYALGTAPSAGIAALRSRAVDQWLRRSLGDAAPAARIEEELRLRGTDPANETQAGDPVLLTRIVAVIDPLAPLCWEGVALWPDGIGPALAASSRDPARLSALARLIATEAAGAWAAARAERCEPAVERARARRLRGTQHLRGPGSGMARLIYLLNPLLPCASPPLAGSWVVGLADLPPALDEAAARDPARKHLIDGDIAAFITVRAERQFEADLATLAEPKSPGDAILAQLRILSQLQLQPRFAPLPGIACWLVTQAAPILSAWHNKARRSALGEQLGKLAEAGQLAPMLALLQDPTARAADTREARSAALELERIDAELDRIASGDAGRADLARWWGQEIAACLGLAALAAALGLAALGG